MSIYDYTVKDRKGNDEEIHEFCTFKYNTQFDQFKKIDVNGENQDSLWAYLKSQKGFEGFDLKGKILIPIVKKMNPNYKTSSDIKWNFTKFLVDREGNVVKRYSPTFEPQKMDDDISALI